MIRHCLWFDVCNSWCITLHQVGLFTGLFSSAAGVPQSKLTEFRSSAAVVPQSKFTEFCSSVAVVPKCKVNLPSFVARWPLCH